MHAVRTASSRASRLAAVLVLAVVAVGCSGGGTPSASDSPPPSEQEVAYYRCLEKEGVVLEKRDDSQLRVDKDEAAKNADVVVRAEAACKDRLPERRSGKPSAETLAAAREFSACMRKEGFANYPDPDPATGDTELPDDLGDNDINTLRAAQRKCAPGAGGDSDNLGG